MSANKTETVTQALANAPGSRSIVPFTGGLIFVIYAFFWPESYGHWLGAIVRAFRDTAGF